MDLGPAPFSFAVAVRPATIAQWRAPPSEPANGAYLYPSAIGLIVRPTVLLSKADCIKEDPSSLYGEA